MGALRLYKRGWAKGCDYSGTDTRREFWWFTVIHAVVYVVAYAGSSQLVFVLTMRSGGSDFPGLIHAFCTFLAITVIALVPWMSMLVRRVRDATGSAIAALVLVLITCGSLIALLLGSVYSTQDSSQVVFVLVVVLAFTTVAVTCMLPSREVEADDPWAR